MTTTTPVRVDYGGRRFSVLFDERGAPLRVKERKKCEHPILGHWYSVSYWSAAHHSLGKGDTLVKRIINAAKAKLDAATP